MASADQLDENMGTREAVCVLGAEAARAGDEERLRRSAELGGAHPYEWDITTNEFLANPEFRRICGLNADEPITYEKLIDRIHPDDVLRVRAAHQTAIRTGSPYDEEYRVVLPDGAIRWILARGEPISVNDGRPTALAGIVIDVTRRKKAELAFVPDAFTPSEEFTRRLLGSSDDCIKVLDLDANLRFMSENGQRVMEVADFGKIEGCYWPDFWNGPAGDEARRAVATARAGGTGRFRGICPTVAGTSKWWDVVVSPINGADGRPERLLSISRDITEAVRAEETLREREALLRSIFQSEGVSMGVVELLDDNAVCVMANEQTAAFFGLTATEIEGKSLSVLGLSRDKVQGWLTFMRECLHKDEATTLEYTLQDGERSIHCLGTFTPLPKSFSEHPRLAVVTIDISQRKRLEEQQAFVARELHHRVKNSLATVQAVISSTARSARSIDDFRQSVTERITSLANTHTLLIENGYDGASLRNILWSELLPYNDKHKDRVTLTGPDTHLPSETAVALGMALHELTTNCAKHGAFSLPTGSIEVSWTVKEHGREQRLELDWRERDGPPVFAPDQEGFGTILLQRVIGCQLGGAVERVFAPTGLHVRISAELKRLPPPVDLDRTNQSFAVAAMATPGEE